MITEGAFETSRLLLCKKLIARLQQRFTIISNLSSTEFLQNHAIWRAANTKGCSCGNCCWYYGSNPGLWTTCFFIKFYLIYQAGVLYVLFSFKHQFYLTQGGIGPAGLSAEDLHVLDLTQQRPRWHRFELDMMWLCIYERQAYAFI